MKNLKISETLTAKKVVKMMLSGFFVITSAMTMTGCSNEKTSQKEDNNVVTSEEPVEKELTPLEKEISELKDFQEVDKTYDNKDLEPFNKMQGYLYSIKEANVNEDLELIELIPPTKDGLAELDKDGEEYKFIGNVIVPCYFIYIEAYEEWAKYYPRLMNDTDFSGYARVDDEYIYATPEELEKTFSISERSQAVQYKLTK